jgi:glycosyltransferase involved in cell wall biosynthesis
MTARLRIGWATPWNERSAIARVNFMVAAELVNRGHAVTVLRTEAADALQMPPLDVTWPVWNMCDTPDEVLLRDFDFVVAHVGDNYGFHAALVDRLGAIGAVGVFHDLFLANLLQSAVALRGGDETELRRAVDETYDPSAWPPGQPFIAMGNLREVAERRPMLEWFAKRTIAAIAHAGHYAGRLRAACPGPVAVIPLVCTATDFPPPPPPSGRMVVSTVGHANANRRIDQITLAIGASPILRCRCRLRVIGEITSEERGRLEYLAQLSKIAPIEFTGWIDNDELWWRLRDVDAICCLRDPILEGASASLLLALASGRPTLVSHHGCYAEIPEDAVMRCEPGAEAFAVMRHLEQLLADPAHGRAIGARAQAFATGNHTPSAYTTSLLAFLEDIAVRRQIHAAETDLGRSLQEFGIQGNDAAAIRVQETLAGLFRSPTGGA